MTAALPEKQTAVETKPALKRGEFFAFFEAGLAVIDQEEVPFGNRLEELFAIVGNPVVHRVAANQPGRAVHLRPDRSLQRGLDIAQQQIWRIPVRFRQLWIEI